MDLGLDGKVALVTASSRGIGRAVAHELARSGAHVVVSARSADQLDSLATEITDLGGAATPWPHDLGDAEATEGLVERVVEAHGALDVVVVNTPGPRITPFLDTTTQQWSDAYDLLLRPAVQLARPAGAQMVKQGSGSIVFLTSTWVKQPADGSVLSAAFRSGVSALAKVMARELAPSGVRVNQVMPGATGTDRMRDIIAAKAAATQTSVDEQTDRVIADIPLGRWAEAAEIAAAVAFLASPRSGFTTGAAVPVDGGAVRSTL